MNIQFVMISVDPEHDTLPQLKNYMAHFGSDLVAIRADYPELFPFMRQLGLIYSKFETNDSYSIIDHSASMVLVNPQQKIVAMLKPQLKSFSQPSTLEAQDILFDLPENMYPERLRLDLGKNVNQDPIKLNSVTLIWNDKKYEFSKEELKNDLRPSKFVIFDKERLIVKTVEVNGRYDPYFYTMNLNNIVDFLLED